MELVLLAVGRLRPSLRSACDDYQRRLKRFVSTSEIELREGSREPSAGRQRRAEAEQFRRRIPPRATVIATTRDGDQWTSGEVARRMDTWNMAGKPLTVMIGGSVGLDEELAREADHRWSLGPLTLPHELARLVVYEQLYRAWTILKGMPYHKGAR